MQWRIRKIIREATECGNPVVGDVRQVQSCNTVPCGGDQDCELSKWTEWGACTSSCDGLKRRSRRIVKYRKGFGRACQDDTKQIAPCNTCGVDAGAVDCKFSDWRPWNACSATCGKGQHQNTREILVHAHNGGKPCEGALSRVQECSIRDCKPVERGAPCMWGEWEQWGACTKCGGQRFRNRHIQQMPGKDGTPCVFGDSAQT